MQQSINNGRLQQPISYFTTYQQFLSKQIPPVYKQPEQNNLTIEDVPKNDKIILLENRTIQKPRRQSYQNKPKTNDKNIKKTVETNGTPPEEPSPKVLKIPPPQKFTPHRGNNVDKNNRVPEPCETINTGPSVDYQMSLDGEIITAYECEKCYFETIYESAFREHMRTHKRKETFHKCPKCPFKIMCRAKVKKHIVMNDEPATKTPYCGLYAYSEECKGDLDLHLKVHRNKRRKVEHSYTRTVNV